MENFKRHLPSILKLIGIILIGIPIQYDWPVSIFPVIMIVAGLLLIVMGDVDISKIFKRSSSNY